MTIENLDYQTDYLFNLLSKDKTNELVAAVNLISPPNLYAVEGTFLDTTTQSGSPIDVPKTVTYGADGDSDNAHITYTSGVFTINTSGWYALKSRIRASRTGAAGSSNLFFWLEASLDGGSTWNITGNSVDVRLSNAEDNQLFFDFSTAYLPAGFKLRSRFSRSSTGNDSGDLVSSSPSALLAAEGVMPSPSAQVTFYKAL